MSELRLIDIRKYKEANSKKIHNGTLSVVEQSEFPTKRVFWISDLYGSSTRAGHAHKKLEQLIVCLRGRCVVRVTKQNGESETFNLKNDNRGLWIPPLHWVDIGDFQRPTILLVLASEKYEINDYINDIKAFVAI